MNFPTSIIPSVNAIAKALTYTRDELRQNHPSPPPLDDEGNEPDIAFRTQLVDGNVHHHWGDPSYDQDHRGVWASTWVYCSDTEEQLQGRAVELRYELEEAWCEAFEAKLVGLPDGYWSLRMTVPHKSKTAMLRIEFPTQTMARDFRENWAGDPETFVQVLDDAPCFEMLYKLE